VQQIILQEILQLFLHSCSTAPKREVLELLFVV
jgi:hypothetical protein